MYKNNKELLLYFKGGKNINRNNTLNTKQVNNTKKQHSLKNNRVKINVPNPAPMDNTRWQPSTHVDYEKYRDLLELQGLLNYFINANKPKPKPWYKEIFDWSTIPEDLFGLPNGVPYFKGGKKIHIKESQKGSFTKYCGGNVTSECIARGKASSDPRIRKKATFADNARKWKHAKGGTLELKDYNDDIDYRNIPINPDALNPYSRFTYGLPDQNWYVGNKGGGNAKWEHDLNTVTTIYKLLQTAIQKYYPKYSQSLIDNLADYMTRHYVKENGWDIVHRAVGGYGTVKTVDEWVSKMKPTYPNAMKATNYNEYVEGLKANYLGNKYNSVNPNYYKEMTKDFGPNTRVDKMLKLIRGIK